MGLIKFATKTANIKYRNYQFTTPCKSAKLHKSFFWDNVIE